jgi:ATP-dependent Clp protease ATP-binding subunit ClpC
MTIESEHLLLGLVHEDGNILSRFVRDATLADVRDEITSRMAIKEKVPTSVDLPLSNESRRILAYAAEEAKRLNRPTISVLNIFCLGCSAKKQARLHWYSASTD